MEMSDAGTPAARSPSIARWAAARSSNVPAIMVAMGLPPSPGPPPDESLSGVYPAPAATKQGHHSALPRPQPSGVYTESSVPLVPGCDFHSLTPSLHQSSQ